MVNFMLCESYKNFKNLKIPVKISIIWNVLVSNIEYVSKILKHFYFSDFSKGYRGFCLSFASFLTQLAYHSVRLYVFIDLHEVHSCFKATYKINYEDCFLTFLSLF